MAKKPELAGDFKAVLLVETPDQANEAQRFVEETGLTGCVTVQQRWAYEAEQNRRYSGPRLESIH